MKPGPRQRRLLVGIALASFASLAFLGLSWRHPCLLGGEVVAVLPAPECPARHDEGASWEFDLGRTSAANLGDVAQSLPRSPLRVLEDGKPLSPHAAHSTIRQEGHGTFSHWGPDLYLSATDNTDPTRNGRRYQVSIDLESARRIGAEAAPRGVFALALVCLVAAAFLLREAPAATRRRFRWPLLLALAGLLAVHLANRWGVSIVAPDSRTYVGGWDSKTLRPPVYPLFVAATSGVDVAERVAAIPAERPGGDGDREDPTFLGVVRGQKIFLVGSLLVLAAVLASELSPPLVVLGCLELVRGGWLSQQSDHVLSEALAQAWMFLIAAAFVVHARGGRDAVWLPTLAALVSALVLTRPAGVYGVVFLAGAVALAVRRRGRRAVAPALAAGVLLAALLAAPTAYRRQLGGGEGGSMAATSRICFALQVAEPGDGAQLAEPRDRRFLEIALERRQARRAEVLAGRRVAEVDEWEFLPQNLYGVALPVAHELGCDDVEACGVFERVSAAVLPAHPLHLARVYAASFRTACRISRVNPFAPPWGGRLAGLALLGTLAALAYGATPRARFVSLVLLLAHAAALGVVAVGDVPIARYVFATEPLVLLGAFVLVTSNLERALPAPPGPRSA